MSNKNPTGALTRLNPEWGSKARKEYDELKGVNHTARRQIIEEQLADMEPTEREWLAVTDAANCWDDHNMNPCAEVELTGWPGPGEFRDNNDLGPGHWYDR